MLINIYINIIISVTNILNVFKRLRDWMESIGGAGGYLRFP